ncbi:hypothetical protein EB796_017117 [Bugula neritina]|uniref:Uncharacterized protein n=1 Tax=Bugula neritina TaxID=10212 RepID=A0A7J7JEU0_BUGNE|nr:hypothetical protein EB796_017117 [Bugula neritina]
MDGTEAKSLHSLLLSERAGGRRSNPGTPWSAYKDYINLAGGAGIVFAIAVLWLITLGTYVISDWLVVYWSDVWRNTTPPQTLISISTWELV